MLWWPIFCVNLTDHGVFRLNNISGWVCEGIPAETKDHIANICWIIEKAREFQKNIYFCFIDYIKALDCVDNNKLWKRWEYQTILPAS